MTYPVTAHPKQLGEGVAGQSGGRSRVVIIARRREGDAGDLLRGEETRSAKTATPSRVSETNNYREAIAQHQCELVCSFVGESNSPRPSPHPWTSPKHIFEKTLEKMRSAVQTSVWEVLKNPVPNCLN
jgi:hypothetical protein